MKLIFLRWLPIILVVSVPIRAENTPIPKLNASVPRVVTSVQPIALFVKEMFGDLIQVEPLIKGSESPHHFSLKASQVNLIANADLLIWVGPQFESFLVGANSQIRKQIRLVDILGMVQVVHHDHHHHGHESDLHVWLDPHLMLDSVDKIVEQLAPFYTAGQLEQIGKRTQKISKKIREVDAAISRETHRGTVNPFVVFHDAYGIFVERLNLDQVASLTTVPDEPIGAKKLVKIRQKVQRAQCLIAERGEASLAQRYAQILDLPLVEVDLLAVADSIKSYSYYLIHLADTFRQCKKNPQ